MPLPKNLILDMKALLFDRKADWFDELNEDQQKDIIERLTEADQGETISHAEAVKLFEKWGLK
jgi:hypothetical protein